MDEVLGLDGTGSHTTCAPVQTHLTVLPHWGVQEETTHQPIATHAPHLPRGGPDEARVQPDAR